MNEDEYYIRFTCFCAGFIIATLLCLLFIQHNGYLRADEKKKIVPIHCVVDYERDGIHYCILENK